MKLPSGLSTWTGPTARAPATAWLARFGARLGSLRHFGGTWIGGTTSPSVVRIVEVTPVVSPLAASYARMDRFVVGASRTGAGRGATINRPRASWIAFATGS